MKRSSLVFLVPVVAAVAFANLYFQERGRNRNPAAAPEVQAGGRGGSLSTPPEVSRDGDSPLGKRNKELEMELAEERAKRKAVEGEVAGLEDEVVVSLGKVADVGLRIGSMLETQAEWRALRAKAPEDRTPEESRRLLELERQRAEALGTLPEIAGFQDHPDEYGEFFRGVFQQAAGLTDAEAGQVETYMRGRAELMVRSGLNEAREPEDPAAEEVWEEQRDAFNEETTDGLVKQLPSGAATAIGLDDSLLELLEGDFDKATDLTR